MWRYIKKLTSFLLAYLNGGDGNVQSNAFDFSLCQKGHQSFHKFRLPRLPFLLLSTVCASRLSFHLLCLVYFSNITGASFMIPGDNKIELLAFSADSTRISGR